jgi:hypothetical protein
MNKNIPSIFGNGIVRIALVTLVILLISAVAMLFTDEVAWGLGDFIAAGVLLFGTGLMYELSVKMTQSHKYRTGIGILLLAALLLVWAELAVGILG